MEFVVDPEQMDEFYEVRQSAYEALRQGTCIERGRSVPICQFLVLPSFENAISWDVIKVRPRHARVKPQLGRPKDEIRLYQSIWRMDVDIQSMRSPVERLKHPRPFKPTMITDWGLLDAEMLASILSRLRGIQIPLLLTSKHVGLDGTGYELAVGDGFCNVRLSWWNDLPDQWQSLRPGVMELEQLFKSTWEQGRG